MQFFLVGRLKNKKLIHLSPQEGLFFFMKIVVISDTHIDKVEKLHRKLIDEISNSDAVIHAGDISNIRVLSELSTINNNIYAVRGNADKIPPDLLPDRLELTFNNIKIGITHGYGSLFTLENRLLQEFEDRDIIIYGHTHIPFRGKYNGQFLLNPGSPTRNRYIDKNSYAILNIENEKYSAEIIYL